MAKKPPQPQPQVGSPAWEEARLQQLAHARRIVLELLRHSAHGRNDVIESLENWLNKFPELRPMVAQYFDLCARTEAVWIERLAASNPVARATIKEEIAALKSELIGVAPTGLERILASTVAVAFLTHQERARGATERGAIPAEMVALDRRAESAQKQFFRAIEFLLSHQAKKPDTAATPSAKPETDAAAEPGSCPHAPHTPDSPDSPDSPASPGYPKLAD